VPWGHLEQVGQFRDTGAVLGLPSQGARVRLRDDDLQQRLLGRRKLKQGRERRQVGIEASPVPRVAAECSLVALPAGVGTASATGRLVDGVRCLRSKPRSWGVVSSTWSAMA